MQHMRMSMLHANEKTPGPPKPLEMCRNTIMLNISGVPTSSDKKSLARVGRQSLRLPNKKNRSSTSLGLEPTSLTVGSTLRYSDTRRIERMARPLTRNGVQPLAREGLPGTPPLGTRAAVTSNAGRKTFESNFSHLRLVRLGRACPLRAFDHGRGYATGRELVCCVSVLGSVPNDYTTIKGRRIRRQRERAG